MLNCNSKLIILLYIRWLGPTRYEISGAKTWMENKEYEGVLSFTLDDTNSTDPMDVENRCLHRCNTCEEMSDVLNKENNTSEGENKHSDTNEYADVSSKVVKSTQYVEGKFMSVTGCVSSCTSPKSPKGLTPSAHLGDGNLDLILVQKTSRMNYLRYLIRTNMPSANNSPFQLPFVRVYRVKEFTFHPRNSMKHGDEQIERVKSTTSDSEDHRSVWNCDGEIISSPSIHAKVYCQILPVFARGVE